MYGRLDAGYNQTKTSDTSGATTTSVTKRDFVKGNGLSTGLWGIRGTEDLGGGLKAKFVHEMDLDINAGKLGVDKGRDSTIGLEGGFGEVRVGRSYTPLFSTIGVSDPFASTGATTVNLYGMDGVRASNAIFYTTPTFSGFTARVMVANSTEKTATTGLATTSKKNAQQGFYGMYVNGPLTAAIGYGEITSDDSTIAGKAKSNGTALAANYDLVVAKIFAGYTKGKLQGETLANTNDKASEFNFGVTVPMGAVTLLGSVGRNTFQSVTAGVASPKAKGTDFVLGATYALSKRTSAYAKMGTYDKFSAGNYSEKTTQTSIGLRHTF